MEHAAGQRAHRPSLIGWLVLGGIAACVSDPDPVGPLTRAQEGVVVLRDGGIDAASGERTPDSAAAQHPDGGSASYKKVSEIIARSCAYHRCHAGAVQGGGLNFAAGVDYRSQLVGVPACAYDGMNEVEPFAPERSWLMVKLTAEARPLEDPYATYIYFDPPAGWDPMKRRCVDQTDDGTPLFGQRMPATAPNILPPDEIEVFRQWIAEGAPP